MRYRIVGLSHILRVVLPPVLVLTLAIVVIVAAQAVRGAAQEFMAAQHAEIETIRVELPDLEGNITRAQEQMAGFASDTSAAIGGLTASTKRVLRRTCELGPRIARKDCSQVGEFPTIHRLDLADSLRGPKALSDATTRVTDAARAAADHVLAVLRPLLVVLIVVAAAAILWCFAWVISRIEELHRELHRGWFMLRHGRPMDGGPA